MPESFSKSAVSISETALHLTRLIDLESPSSTSIYNRGTTNHDIQLMFETFPAMVDKRD
jgi:hypothetical protein